MIGDQFLLSGYLESGENIIFVGHKHIFLLLKSLLYWIFFGALLPFGVFFLWPQTLIWSAGWGGIFLFWFLVQFLDWYYDAWILTNRAVIDLEWNGLFHRLSSRISYADIRDISLEKKGIFGTLFDFGTAKIGLPSGGEVILKGMARLKKIESVLLQNQEIAKSLNHTGKIEKAHEILGEMIAHYLQKRK